MCSWCWGFKPVWTRLQAKLPAQINVEYLLGGLAKDSNIPMPMELQVRIRNTWHTIQNEIPGITFNFDFWLKNEPRRSTYPACRAIIATRKQNKNLHLKMIDRIQQAYYLQAQNPSDLEVLIQCAKDLQLDIEMFTKDISSAATQTLLDEEIDLATEMGAQGFPSLILNYNDTDYFIEINYNTEDIMLKNIERIMNKTD